MKVLLQERLLAEASARVSALDRGLLYGDGLFETIRTYGGRPFALAAHLRRLRSTARQIALPVPGDEAAWKRRIRRLLAANRLERADVAIRITITRGSAGKGLVPPSRGRPTVLLTVQTLDPRLSHLRSRGVRAVVLPFHPGLGGFLTGRKTVDYLTASIGKRFARARGAFEGIYSTPRGELLEGTTSNLFAVRGRTLLTPPLAAGILPGITRSIVLRLAAKAGIGVEERPILRRDLREGFLTATTLEVMPIRAIDGVALRAPGPTTRRLQELYRELVGARL